VASLLLNDEQVFALAIEIVEGRMAQRVKSVETVESGASLPGSEVVPESSAGDSSLPAGNKKGRVKGNGLPVSDLPPNELAHLEDKAVGKKDLLVDGTAAGALENSEWDALFDSRPLASESVENVADVESGDLVLAKSGAESQGVDDVVADSSGGLAGNVKKPGLLNGGKGRGGKGRKKTGHIAPPTTSSKKNTTATIVTKAAVEDKPEEGSEPPPEGSGPLIIVKRNEQETVDWMATEAGFLEGVCDYGEEPLRMEPFQHTFLNSKARYRCVEKARQVGFSFLFAAEAIARCHFREQGTSIFVSYNLEDAKEKINYARQLHEEMPLEYRKKLVTDSKTELGFMSNGSAKKISRIISNPSKAPRGKKGDIYLDELAHYVNDREVYGGSTALIIRSQGQLTVCSSPLGRRGKFWEISQQETRKYPSFWRQSVPWWLCASMCKDVIRASVEAPGMLTKDRVYKYGNQDLIDQYESLDIDDFQQEFEVMYVDESYSFYPYDLIMPCTRDEDSLYVASEFAEITPRGRLTAGFDVGRKRDLSELSIFDDTDKKRCVLIKTFDDVPFRKQEAELRHMLNLLPIARLSIDQNGIGMQLAENLSMDYPEVVVPEVFSNESKEIWAHDFKILMQKREIELPRTRKVTAQIHSIKRRLTAHGRPTFEVETNQDVKGHADLFWSFALAVRKERGVSSKIEVELREIGEDAIPDDQKEESPEPMGLLERLFDVGDDDDGEEIGIGAV